MDIQACCLELVPLNVVLVGLPAPVVEVVCHDKLETSEVVESGDHKEEDAADSTEQSTELR